MKTEKSAWIVYIELIIYAILTGLVLYVLFRPVYYILQMSTVAVCAVIICMLIWTGGNPRRDPGKMPKEVSKIVLLDDDGERIKEWLVKGETSVLIGKNTERGEVDIDLTGCEYASLVSPEHAVLNRVGEDWFIEDAESYSGTGIRKAGRSDANRLIAEEPVRVGAGDMIFIANTRLLIK